VIDVSFWAIGAIPVFVPENTIIPSIKHSISLTTASHIITNIDVNSSDLVQDDLTILKVSDLNQPFETFSTQTVFGNDVKGDTIASIVMTSGSSGKPKGVCQLHKTLVAGCEAVFGFLGT